MNIKAQKAKKILQEIAKKTAKDVGHELGEIPKRTPSQLTGVDSGTSGDQDIKDQRPSPIVEAMQQSSNLNDGELEKKKQIKFIQDKSKVDEEIEKYRRKREELERVWAETQAKMTEDETKIEPGEPLPIPSSKPSRGKVHPGKQKSPEKRLGKK